MSGSVRVPGLKPVSSALPLAYTSTVAPGTACRIETVASEAAWAGRVAASGASESAATAAIRGVFTSVLLALVSPKQGWRGRLCQPSLTVLRHDAPLGWPGLERSRRGLAAAGASSPCPEWGQGLPDVERSARAPAPLLRSGR